MKSVFAGSKGLQRKTVVINIFIVFKSGRFDSEGELCLREQGQLEVLKKGRLIRKQHLLSPFSEEEGRWFSDNQRTRPPSPSNSMLQDEQTR